MKILLDENLPHDLRHFLPQHDVFTIDFMGWKGLKNGRLLAMLGQEGFDVLLTLDTGIPFQHNNTTLPSAVVILRARSSRLSDLLPRLNDLHDALAVLQPRSVVVV